MNHLSTLVYFVAKIAAAEPGTPTAGVIPTLLTGGGFAFLTIIMTGLFMWNKNKAESANSVAQGAATWAKGMSEELNAYKNWASRRRIADRTHTEWDDQMVDQLRELVRMCEEKGVIEKDSIKLRHPPMLEVPFVDPFLMPKSSEDA